MGFFMTNFLKIIRLINVLSIDVVMGAMAMAYLWSHFFQIEFNKESVLSLGLTVWLIYTADHLLDVRKGKKRIGLRYEFHQNNFKVLIIASSIVLFILLVSLFLINIYLLYAGFVLLSSVVFHFVFVHRKQKKKSNLYPKEWVIALVYTLGISVPYFIQMYSSFNTEVFVIFLMVFLAATQNLFLLSFFESNEDRSHDVNAIAIRLGVNKLKYYIIGLSALSVSIVLLFLVFGYHFGIGCTFLFIAFSYLFIYLFREKLKEKEKYRLLIDSVLLAPLLLALF